MVCCEVWFENNENMMCLHSSCNDTTLISVSFYLCLYSGTGYRIYWIIWSCCFICNSLYLYVSCNICNIQFSRHRRMCVRCWALQVSDTGRLLIGQYWLLIGQYGPPIGQYWSLIDHNSPLIGQYSAASAGFTSASSWPRSRCPRCLSWWCTWWCSLDSGAPPPAPSPSNH